MNISFGNALGIHEKALQFRVDRAEVLANNLANSDTPGFKARDMDFKALFANEIKSSTNEKALKMETTNGSHLADANFNGNNALLYRTPSQPSVDGNTVDTQQETAEFMKNTLQYQSSFQFLSGRFKSMTNAIRGE